MNYDIVGNDPSFYITDLRYRISAKNTTILFPQSAYLANMIVKELNTDGTITDFSEYDVVGCLDDTLIAEIKVSYPTFNLNLYKGIRFTRTVADGESYLVTVSYHSAVPNVITSSADTESGPICTPALLKAISNDIVFLKALTSANVDNGTSTNSLFVSLPMDLTATAVSNLVAGEIHSVDTTTGKNVISPAKGSFYKTGVIVKNASGTVLTLGEDYSIVGLDLKKTGVAEATCGVYRYIVMHPAVAYNNTVEITYHAFGGDVSAQDMESISANINRLQYYIFTKGFLTDDSLAQASIIQQIVRRLNTHDGYYRSLNLSGIRNMSRSFTITPMTGDVTNSSNWYSIAHLYKQTSNDGYAINTVVYKDSIRLKIYIETLNVFYDVVIVVNTESGKMTITPIATEGAGASGTSVNLLSILKFRLVYISNHLDYGATLQLQIPIASGETGDLVRVENYNKAGTGGWIFRTEINGTDDVRSENTEVLMPDGLHSWQSTGGITNKSIVVTPSTDEGFTVWAGNYRMDYFDPYTVDMTNSSVWKTLFPVSTSVMTDLTMIKRVTFEVYDRLTGVTGQYHADVSTYSTGELKATACIDPTDLSRAMAWFSISNGVFSIKMQTVIAMRTAADCIYDLRKIIVNKGI